MALVRQFRKKHRYKRNIFTLLLPSFLAIIIILIATSTPSLWRESRLAYFDVYNAQSPHYPNPEDFDCLIVLNNDTIFRQFITYKYAFVESEYRNSYSFSRKIAQGKHILKVYNLSTNPYKVDTLHIKNTYQDESIYIRYEHQRWVTQSEQDKILIRQYSLPYLSFLW